MDPSHEKTQPHNELQPEREKCTLSKGEESKVPGLSIGRSKTCEDFPKSTTIDTIEPGLSRPDSVGLNQDIIFTRAFIFRLLIEISTLAVFAMCYALYICHIQKELADNITKFRLEGKEIEGKIEQMRSDLGAMNVKSLSDRQDKHANLLVLLSAIVVPLLLCVLWLYQRSYPKIPPSASVPTRRRQLEHPPVQNRSNLVAQNRDLQDKVCIILFNENLQGEITKLLEDLKMPDFQYEFYTIRKHEEITGIPKCKMFLMCCEFTERHVIIEQQGLGLGDLHRRTYDKTMEVNGNLIILYIHDPGSRNLGNKHFNENIHCVKSQPELSHLRDNGSFFSCYIKLTDFQTNKLREKLTKYM